MRPQDAHVRRFRLYSSPFFARPARSISHPAAEATIIGISECEYWVKSVLSPRVRVRLEIQLPPSPVGHVGVELGRSEIGMAEQFLNTSQVGASLE